MRFAVTGNSAQDISALLPEGTEIVAADGVTQPEAVLIDAASATPSDAQLTEWLQAGIPVAIAGITPALGDTLERLTGSSAPGDAPLVAYRLLPGTEPAQFHVSVLQHPLVGGDPPVAPEGEEAAPEDTSAPVASDPSVAKASEGFFDLPSAPKGAGGLLKGASEAFAPMFSGAMYGADALNRSVEGKFGRGWDCDRRYNERSTEQSTAGAMNITFHCYWADGEVTPYYLVAVKQQYEYNPCFKGSTKENNWSWEGWSKGWFMHRFHFRPLTIEVSGSGARLDSSNLVARWPMPVSQNKETFTAEYSLMMRGRGEGGAREKRTFTLSSGEIVNEFKGWESRDISNPANRASAWSYFQHDDWNAFEKPVDTFRDWWREIYRYHPEKSDYVHDFPAQSRQTLHASTVSIFKVPCSSSKGSDGYAAPPPVTMTLKGAMDIDMVGFHCCEGCTKGSHHMFLTGHHNPWDKTLNLKEICS